MPVFLGAQAPQFGPEGDRLSALADWVASPDNAFFARGQVNRIWLHLMGRGLVDPNDDFRERPTRPRTRSCWPFWRRNFTGWISAETNGAAEARHGQPHLPACIDPARPLHHGRRSCTTPMPAYCRWRRAVARCSQPGSGACRCSSWVIRWGCGRTRCPPPQSGRRGTAGMGERFLKTFGKPDRLLTCECERNDDPGLCERSSSSPAS